MFKLTKYEFRKNITAPAIFLAVILAVELFFLGSIAIAAEGFAAPLAYGILTFIMLFSFFIVLIFSIASYSKELRSKSGYMTFMAPISTYQIIGSKLLSSFLVAAIFAVLFFVLLPVNTGLLASTYTNIGTFFDFAKEFIELLGYNFKEIVVNGAVLIFELMVSFYYVVVLAYFAISLSSTVFQEKKFKWVVTTVIFVVLYATTSFIADKIPMIGDPVTIGEAFIAELPVLSFYVVCIIASYIGSAMLLEKKISL